MKGAKTIATVIVNFRSAHYVERLLSSGALDDTAVVLVDNGSEPADVGRLCTRYGAVPVLLGENVGFARGVNAGIDRVARSGAVPRHLLIVNPDVSVPVGAITRLQAVADSLDADGVCPLILVEPTGTVQGANGGGPLTLWSVAAYYWWLSRLFPNARGLFLNRRQVGRLTAPTRLDWIPMTCLLVRWDALERFGRIPEAEFMYGEDIAWGVSASKAGAGLFLVPSVTIEHVGGASGDSTLDRHLGPVQRLIRAEMGAPAASVASFIVWSGLRIRHALGLPTGMAVPPRDRRGGRSAARTR
jgi:GT2 family glycosyltransferase